MSKTIIKIMAATSSTDLGQPPIKYSNNYTLLIFTPRKIKEFY